MFSRRQALAGSAAAVTVAAATTNAAAAAIPDDSDAELLARVKAFDEAYDRHCEASGVWHKEHERVHSLPECPRLTAECDRLAYFEARDEFLDKHGLDALADASNLANEAQGAAALAVFAIPALTLGGVLAKLRIVRLAVGTGSDDQDHDLEAFQPIDAPWIDNALGDLERLAGTAPS